MMTREEKKAWHKAHYAKNRIEILARQKAYASKHRETRAAYQRAYYAKNPKRHVTYQKTYRKKHSERFVAYQKAYNLKIRGFTVKEITIEKYLVGQIEALGGFCPKFIDGGRRGAPDRLVIVPGNPVHFVELKRPALARLEPWQKRYHEQLRACGQKVWVLNSIEAVDDFLLTL
jgi:hypothetical protein